MFDSKLLQVTINYYKILQNLMAENDSKHTINLGKKRIRAINKFRAKEEIQGKRLSSIEKAVNKLIDKALTKL